MESWVDIHCFTEVFFQYWASVHYVLLCTWKESGICREKRLEFLVNWQKLQVLKVFNSVISTINTDHTFVHFLSYIKSNCKFKKLWDNSVLRVAVEARTSTDVYYTYSYGKLGLFLLGFEYPNPRFVGPLFRYAPCWSLFASVKVDLSLSSRKFDAFVLVRSLFLTSTVLQK